MVGNIESGLTSTVKSWIIGFKTAPAACHIVWKDMAVSEDQDSCAESKYGRKRVHGTVERIPGSPGIQGTDSGGRKCGGSLRRHRNGFSVEMVGNLTSGKKKFAIYEEDVQKILARLGGARMDFIRLEKADEQAFQPLSEVYRMKAETKEEKTEKEERMEECLKAAAKVPMEVMERAVSVMDDIEFLALHGSGLR